MIAVHMNYRQDPTAAPGTFYQAYTFDAYRVKDGKYVEHWDTAVINPPAPPGPAQQAPAEGGRAVQPPGTLRSNAGAWPGMRPLTPPVA